MGGFGRPPESLGAVVDAVEARHRGHQRRGGADVRRGLLAFDVLFAHLERHAQRFAAQTVHRDADDAARHVAFVGFARGHVAGAGSSEAHRRAEALARTHGDVGAPFARRLQQRERQQVRHGRNERPLGVSGRGEGGVVAHMAVGGGILHDGAELLAREFVLVVVVDDQFDPEGFAAREQHVERLREEVAVDEELAAPLPDRLARAQGEHHEHRLGRGGPFVQQRAVADLHARERDHGRLEVQERFEAALRDFGLIGRIGGVPCGVLEDVAHDGGRHGIGVVSHADERPQAAVALGQRTDVRRVLVFAHALRGQRDGFLQTDGLRDHLCDQFLDRSDADGLQHGFQVAFAAHADVARSEFVEHCVSVVCYLVSHCFSSGSCCRR